MTSPHILLTVAIALVAITVVAAFLSGHAAKPISRTRQEVAQVIENFLSLRGGSYEWDDFTTFSIADPQLEAIRRRCARLPEEFPSELGSEYCSEAGRAVLQAYVDQLRGRAA